MRLIRGAAGAGKTALVFREFKQALRDGRGDSSGLRIVVPTATLVRHFQHELARDREVFAPSCIVSLTRFAKERAPEIQLVPDALLRVIVRDCLQRIAVPEFSEVDATEGMAATLIDTIGLFENADCSPDRLAAVRKLSGQAKAFERLWRAIESAVHETGHHTRAELLRAAAANTRHAQVWMDGFLNLSPSETTFVRGLARTCELTLSLADSPVTDEVRRLALQLGAEDRLLTGKSRKPSTAIFQARTVEREADEIARRVLNLNGQGTHFRQIGVALRDPEAYVPLLRATFERFGIPARFYFSHPLGRHPVAIFLGGLIAGPQDDWDFETTLEALRCNPRWAGSLDFDRFDFAVREAMPGHGAEMLVGLCEDGTLRKEIAECLKTDAWKNESRNPAEWLRRFEYLATALYRPGAPDAAAASARSHVAALRAWLEAIRSIVPFWTDSERAITLDQFWQVAGGAIDSAVFHIPDDRANVVHVMSVYEARQWDVDAMFVCGMVDRDFPRRQPQNLLFTDQEIDPLRKAGIPLRKASDLENDEYGLFESLRSRAAKSLFLSFPLHDASGKSSQPSRFLDTAASVETAPPCRPEVHIAPPAAALPGHVRSADLLARMANLHESISLTALEDLSQCRFKFFAGKTLSLKPVPELPGDRLSAKVTGSIMHWALDRWLKDRSRVFVEVFEETFDEACRQQHLPPGYKLEVKRIEFRKIAQKVSASEQWKPDSSESEVELDLDFPGRVQVKCRIDRIDRFGDECVILDYKSGKTKSIAALVESSTRLQGPLYALAARERLNLNPVGVLYWAVRDDQLHGWGHIPGTSLEYAEMPPNWSVDARERTVERLTGFLGGQVHAHPEEKQNCRWCDFAGACRVEQQALVMIEGAHGS